VFSAERFLVVWAACVLGFFSISSSKMAPYVLPAVPALALMAGVRIVRLAPGGVHRRVLPPLILMGALLLLGGAVLAYVKHNDPQSALYLRFGLWLAVAGMLALASAAVVMRMRRSNPAALVAVALAALVATQLALLGYQNLIPLRSAHLTALEIQPYLRPDTVVFSVGRYDQTLPPYLGRTVALVAVGGELSFGIEQEPERALPDLARFAQAWGKAPHAIAVMEESSYQAARAQGLPMTVISQSRQRITVRKPE
jgi:4-amino-4-deoxy-L-arabinose transferase-like glycosyltransferase